MAGPRRGSTHVPQRTRSAAESDSLRLAGRKRQLPVGVRRGEFRRKRLAVDRHGDGRIGLGERDGGQEDQQRPVPESETRGGTP